MKALECQIKGIKCDVCDYINKNVKFEDYEDWLNKPCPKCGANLLTHEDYESAKAIIEIANILNMILPEPKEDEKRVTMRVEMNGTGKMNFKIKGDNNEKDK